MNVLVIYDDTAPKSEVITDVIGEKSFSEVVVKRQTLGDRFKKFIYKTFSDAELITISSGYEFNSLVIDVERKYEKNTRVLHFFSNYIVSDEEAVSLSFRKIPFIDENYLLLSAENTVGIMSPNIGSYLDFLELIIKSSNYSFAIAAKSIECNTSIEGLIDIGIIENFIQCIAGNFDARYFNSLQGDEYTIIKTSTNIQKIKAEYCFYHLLPEDMQFWFVEPFNYTETTEKASYTMERLHMTDLAIKWVHGSIGETEFLVILDKYFYFFQQRSRRDISEKEYRQIADGLYSIKLVERIENLKAHPKFTDMHKLLTLNARNSIDDIVRRYFLIKDKLETKIPQECISVIGHGDPCFANTMYNKSTRTLKFIDPKGAVKEEDLWTNPYYDIAKLSHSICGRYDFFNNALFDISINSSFETELKIDFDNSRYIDLFRQKLEENGYNYWLVRLYEASLFLSMLPLHMDNPHKVYAFILNANNILKEIENYV